MFQIIGAQVLRGKRIATFAAATGLAILIGAGSAAADTTIKLTRSLKR